MTARDFGLLGLLALSLAACGSGGTTSQNAAAAPPLEPADSNGFAAYSPAADTISLSDGGTTLLLQRNATFDTPGFRGYRVLANGYSYASTGETSSGAGYATIGVSPAVDLGAAGATFGRVTATVLPDTGSATLSGPYSGWIVANADGVATWLIKGAMTATVDFDAMEVSGTVHSRASAFSAAQSFADIALAPSPIVDGEFSGTLSGGAGNGAILSTASGGTVTGLIVGVDGGEVVGAIALPHTIGGAGYVEHGAFVAE